MSARPVIVCSHGFNDFHTIIVNMISDRIVLKGLIERAYDHREGHPDSHVFTVNIKRELLTSIYDEIMSYNMISDDVAPDDMNDAVNVIIHVMNTYANTPVEIRYDDSDMMDYVHSFLRHSNEITNDNMFETVIMCMRD